MQIPFLDLKAMNDPIRSELDQCYQEVLDESCFVFGKQVNDFEKAFAENRTLSIVLALRIWSCKIENHGPLLRTVILYH